MKRELIISFSGHIILLVFWAILSPGERVMKPPEKVYRVQIISGPQRTDEPELTPELEEPKQEVKEEKPPKEPEQEVVIKNEEKQEREPEPKTEIKEQPETRKIKQDFVKEGAGVSIDQPDFDDSFFLSLIVTKVANNWRDPVGGSKRYVTVIYFKLLASGQIRDAEIEQRSGNSLFDRSCLRAVLLSNPLPELPDDFEGDFLGVHFRFEHR